MRKEVAPPIRIPALEKKAIFGWKRIKKKRQIIEISEFLLHIVPKYRSILV